jgi:hypothetical protein
VPSTDGFHAAFMFGLGAAVLCTVIAIFIPQPDATMEQCD